MTYAQIVVDPVTADPIDGDGKVVSLDPDVKVPIVAISPKVTDEQVIVAFSRTLFTDPAITVIFGLEDTEDGVTWNRICSATTMGGEIKNTPISSLTCPIRAKTKATRKTQAFITPKGGKLDTGVLLLTK
jgi:hypothetical protein